MSASAEPLTESTLRRWLASLRQPDRLADAQAKALLQAHGRLPLVHSTVAVGGAVRDLLIQSIDGLRPGPGSSPQQEIPYLVLKTCFVEGAKREAAAARLRMSTRQLTRERSRAIKLLADVLTARAGGAQRVDYRPERIPAIVGFLPRPAVSRALSELLTSHRLVHVHGPRGAGKTSLVADLASEATRRIPVFWYRFRPGVNVTLGALCFELGEHLRAGGRPALSTYLSEALPRPDFGILSRIAIRDLADLPQMFVLDDAHLAETDAGIASLIEEAVSRLPDLRVITVGRHRLPKRFGADLALPPMTRIETQALLAQLDVRAGPVIADTVHSWTEGLPHLVTLAAAWVKSARPDDATINLQALNQEGPVQDFLLESIVDLLDSADRAILDAASVFRDRFTDEALAFVAGQTVGTVEDTSRRLVRRHLAVRSRGGDVAFFHSSIREFFYARLDEVGRQLLHGRAAQWYQQQGNRGEVAYHKGSVRRG